MLRLEIQIRHQQSSIGLPRWKHAIILILENESWELGKLPNGFKALPIKWMYMIREMQTGTLSATRRWWCLRGAFKSREWTLRRCMRRWVSTRR